MTTHRPHARATRAASGAIATALLAALTLTACTGGGDATPTNTQTTSSPAPTQTPTPAQSPTPTLSAQDKNIAAAKAAYEQYVAVSNQVKKGGMKDGQKVTALTGSLELMQLLDNYFTQARKQKLRQTGETKIASLTATKYVVDPTGSHHEQVHLRACIDNEGVDVVKPDGSSALLKGYIQRQYLEVLMQHQKDGRWTVNKDDATGKSC